MTLPVYSAIYAFGDSLSDAGNLSITTGTANATQPISPPYYQEKYGSISGNVFSNGPVWVQSLSQALNLGTLKPALAGGTDFAYGGAETGGTPQNENQTQLQAISLPSQLRQFQTGVPNPSAAALYTVSIGSNDVLDILADPALSAAQQTIDINDAVANEISFLKSLVSGGAKNLLVLNVPDLGKTPYVTSGAANGTNTPSAGLNTLASQLSAEYNTALASQIGTIGAANVAIVDSYGLIDNAVANPTSYGLVNTSSPVWTGTYTSSTSGTVTVNGTAQQNQYLFWDKLHPTQTGHLGLTAAAEQIIGGKPPLTVTDSTAGATLNPIGLPYTGPVANLQQTYQNPGSDNLSITASTPNWFILTGSGTDAISVTSGTNVLDGGSGSNFLSGGSGTDTFFVDDRGATTSTWSTIANFGSGDSATIWGVSAADFTVSWLNSAGAAGYTGLTMQAAGAGKATALVTLAGYTQSDLTNGKLAVSYGNDAGGGGAYLNIHAA